MIWHGYLFDANPEEQPLAVDYCISQPVAPQCQLEFNLPLLAIVIGFNIVKVICMAFAAITILDEPLITIGDAIALFMDNPDPYTRDMCLASKNHFRDKSKHPSFSPLRTEYQPQRVRLFNAARYGALVATVLISNSPQLILSMMYLVFNSLCTTLFLSLEWSSYFSSRKPLCVSRPRGQQRSTYFLQIPYRFGLPMMIYSVLLHWLVSQSIFLVKIDYFENGALDISSTSCGYSPLGIFFSTIMCASLILSTVILGFFIHLNGDMPLVGSCSAAIAAACHPSDNGSDPMKPIKWGAIPNMEYYSRQGIGHISFSSGDVLGPIPGFYYC
ncbi:hypothetical protein GYMLUDRAFT_174985 [Collybiopsis luxurians FD-317 M1]|uniref:Uncharacterized protein n=1 Tax=Collybiopsis luxurians FD-317 M1 TaxID=944289 RepID=A0A0D0CCR3_9AGAR|nr:hypothetical protein GYMLUDRAFT_174985 [Collybiopsis luxurians FD-317 M1]